jgi:pyruvate/2-oxoglutarate dehydrogenase complex dihydrolipoamide dehydrogenase (E3) component
MIKYDLIVIGGGAGGLTVAAGTAGLGAKVALIDKGQLGGDCLWNGCVPTKSLIHSASIVHAARQANMFGMMITGRPAFSWARQRLNDAIADIQRHDDPERFKAMGIDVYNGYGSFISPHEVTIGGGETIWAKKVVISTGSRPAIPMIAGLQQSGYLTNETALQLEQIPESMAVVGGGPNGLEFAQSFARMGCKVTVIESDSSILMKEDLEMAPFVRRALERDGITFLIGATIMRIEGSTYQKEITYKQDDVQYKLVVEQILLATGRKPNTDHLNLQHAGIRTDHGYIIVDRYLRTSQSHIYAIGDVNGRFPFTHKAGYEGKLVVTNAVLGLRRKVDYSNMPWVTYTDPEVFHLGLTEEEAEQQKLNICIYRTPLDDVDRFVADRDTDGIIKIITTKNGKIIGAHAVGRGAGDFMQEVVFAKHYGHKIGAISHVIHPYPTHAASVQRTADLYWREALFIGVIPKLLALYMRWFR